MCESDAAAKATSTRVNPEGGARSDAVLSDFQRGPTDRAFQTPPQKANASDAPLHPPIKPQEHTINDGYKMAQRARSRAAANLDIRTGARTVHTAPQPLEQRRETYTVRSSTDTTDTTDTTNATNPKEFTRCARGRA